MAGDPHWASCVYFPDFTGSNGNTTFTDQSDSARSITTVGDAQTQSNQLDLDGAGDYLYTVDHADFSFGSGEFAIAAVFTVDVLSSVATITAQYNATGNERGWHLKVNGSGILGLNYSTNGTDLFSALVGDTTLVAGTEYEVLVERDASNQLRIYLDGVMDGSVAHAVTYNDSAAQARIGATSVSDFDYMDGKVGQLKIWKGASLVASDSGYTPGSLFEVGPLIETASTGPRGMRNGPGRMGVH